jgi:hypothetical protein
VIAKSDYVSTVNSAGSDAVQVGARNLLPVLMQGSERQVRGRIPNPRALRVKENDQVLFSDPSDRSTLGLVTFTLKEKSGTRIAHIPYPYALRGLSVLGAAVGRYSDAEQPLALDLLGCFGPGMVVLADRKFLSWAMARAFLAAGAHILWRTSASFALKPVKVLPDGTYLAELKPPRTSDGPPVTVRVIEYTVHTTAADGTEESSEVFCLVTDLLDAEGYPALDLACAYPLRWGSETVIGHHKTDMGEGQPVVRSGDPEGVMQEMWALFAVYQAICRIVGIAVDAAGIPPNKVSFPHALAAATSTGAAFPPLTRQASPSPRSWPRSSCPVSSPATARTGPARGKPRRPETFPPASPASAASPESPEKSSSICSIPGRWPKSKAIGPAAREDA